MPRAGVGEAGEHPREARLARPVRAGEQHHPPGRDVEVDPGEHGSTPRRAGVVDDVDAPQAQRPAGGRARRTPRHPARPRRRGGAREREHGVGLAGVVVGDVQDPDALGAREAAQQVGDLGAALGVEHRRALVADDDGGGAREQGRDGETLQLAARERRGLAVAGALEADPGQQLVDRHGVTGREAPAQVVGDAHAQHLAVGALEHHPGAADDAEPGLAGTLGGALGGRTPRDDAPERRLAGPVRPGDHDEPAGVEVQVHRRPRRQRDPAQAQRQRRHRRARAGGGQAAGEVGRQQALHRAQRPREDPGRDRHADQGADDRDRGQRHPPVVGDRPHRAVPGRDDLGQPAAQQAGQAAPRGAQLVEHQLPVGGERGEQRGADQRGGHGEDDDAGERGAHRRPPAARADADEPAQRRRGRRRARRADAGDEERDDHGDERPDRPRPPRSSRRQHGQREGRDDHADRADREQAGEHADDGDEITEGGRLRELDRVEGPAGRGPAEAPHLTQYAGHRPRRAVRAARAGARGRARPGDRGNGRRTRRGPRRPGPAPVRPRR